MSCLGKPNQFHKSLNIPISLDYNIEWMRLEHKPQNSPSTYNIPPYTHSYPHIMVRLMPVFNSNGLDISKDLL